MDFGITSKLIRSFNGRNNHIKNQFHMDVLNPIDNFNNILFAYNTNATLNTNYVAFI